MNDWIQLPNISNASVAQQEEGLPQSPDLSDQVQECIKWLMEQSRMT